MKEGKKGCYVRGKEGGREGVGGYIELVRGGGDFKRLFMIVC